MKHIALILGLTLPVTLLSCVKAEAQTAKQNVEFDSIEEKIAALEAQLGANLKYEKDDDGNERWYDSKGYLIHYKDSTGYERWYDSKGNLIHEKRSYGYEEWHEYDSKGHVIHYKNSNGYEEWHDSKGNLIHDKHSTGYEAWHEYDSKGYLIHEKSSDGDETWYDSNGHEIHYKDSDGDETWYDSNGHEIHYKDSDGYEGWTEYDSKGNLIHYKDSKGYEKWYDSKGNEIHHKDSTGYEEWYDSKGYLIHHKDSKGYEEWYEYDSDGHKIHHKDSKGYEEWYEYDSKGNLIHYKNSDGYERWTEYDSKGYLIHEKSSDGDETWYDSNGHEIHEKRSDGYEEWHEYDSNGHEIHEKRSDGYEEWHEYDSNGHLIHSKDSNGDEKWYEYENVTDSDYGYDMFVYDSNGRLTFSGYGKDNVFGLFDEETSYVYDDTGNLVHTTTKFGGSGNDWYREERDYWSNGMIKNFHSESKRSETDVLFNNEGKVPLSEEYVKLEPYMCYVYVEYKNSRSFRIWCVTAEEDSMKLGKTTFDSEAFEIHYDKSGKINTVKAWHQEKEINYAFYYLLYLDISTILSREKNLEISEDNTITFKQWPPDMGGDVIHEKLLPKTDWEKYFDKNGNFTAVDLSWINKCWFKKYENDEYLRPQKNKH